ncbi:MULTISPECIES: hypothetical protein [unclassified Bartonella]|uniref:hypothetical protein n=1 Tax=unclassified Bartonella TaxID=2645622 RepID=UPI0035D0E392
MLGHVTGEIMWLGRQTIIIGEEIEIDWGLISSLLENFLCSLVKYDRLRCGHIKRSFFQSWKDIPIAVNHIKFKKRQHDFLCNEMISMYNISVISMGNFTGSTVRILSSAYPQIANISKQQRWRMNVDMF